MERYFVQYICAAKENGFKAHYAIYQKSPLQDGMDQMIRHAEEGDAGLTRQTLCGLEATLQRIRNAIAGF